MSGYVRTGSVQTIGASWTVPGIGRRSRAGLAATWIGAQGPGVPPAAPFIQVGTNENRGDPGVASSPTVYVAFWSASQLNFHPHALFPVAPGDRITAALRLGTGRWQVSIADASNGHHDTFTTTADSTGPFTLAEWLQEDPAGSGGRPVAYPRIGRVAFAGLSINGAAPAAGSMQSQWMTAAGRDFGPTALRDDAFTIAPVTPSPAGIRYLRLVTPANAVQQTFDAQARRWDHDVSAAQIRPAVDRELGALRTLARGLAAGSWPAAAGAAIQTLIARIGALEAVVSRAPVLARIPTAGWPGDDLTATLRVAGASHRVRRLLNLPEVATPTAGSTG